MNYRVDTLIVTDESRVIPLEQVLPGMPFSLLIRAGVASSTLDFEQVAVARAARDKRPILPWTAMERCRMRFQWAMTPEENLHMDIGYRTELREKVLRLPRTYCKMYYPKVLEAMVWYPTRKVVCTESMWLRCVGEWVIRRILSLKRPSVMANCEGETLSYCRPAFPLFASTFMKYFLYVREEPVEHSIGEYFKDHELQLLMVIEKYNAWYKQWCKDGQPVIVGKWIEPMDGGPIMKNQKTYTRSDDEEYIVQLRNEIAQ